MRLSKMRVGGYIPLDEMRRVGNVLANAASDRTLGERAKKRDMHP